MSRLIALASVVVVALCALAADEKAKEEPATAPASVLDFTVKDIDGKETKLADKYKGKVLVIVNTASI